MREARETAQPTACASSTTISHPWTAPPWSVVQAGDLVFFDNTWDFNGDGRINDPLTHVGIVEAMETDGTIVFISRVAGAIERYRMNVAQPHVHRTADGRVLNDYLRRKHWRDGEQTPYLTGELFAAFGTRVVESSAQPPDRRYTPCPLRRLPQSVVPNVTCRPLGRTIPGVHFALSAAKSFDLGAWAGEHYRVAGPSLTVGGSESFSSDDD